MLFNITEVVRESSADAEGCATSVIYGAETVYISQQLLRSWGLQLNRVDSRRSYVQLSASQILKQ